VENRCENCGELIEEISDPDPSLSSDALLSEDLLCKKCRFLLQAQTEE